MNTIRVIDAKSIRELEDKLETFLSDGWETRGGIEYLMSEEGTIDFSTCYQTIVSNMPVGQIIRSCE
jgi:hypothetical protein